MLCGKIGAGKSTLAAKLAAEDNAILCHFVPPSPDEQFDVKCRSLEGSITRYDVDNFSVLPQRPQGGRHSASAGIIGL
jgi:hypothetical protein